MEYLRILVINCIILLLFIKPVHCKDNINKKLNNKQEQLVSITLQRISKQINNQLPLMVDEETRLDTTMVVRKHFFYKYTLVNVRKNELEGYDFNGVVTNTLKTSACSSNKMIKMLSFGVVYDYMYFDKIGSLITTVQINKNSCVTNK